MRSKNVFSFNANSGLLDRWTRFQVELPNIGPISHPRSIDAINDAPSAIMGSGRTLVSASAASGCRER